MKSVKKICLITAVYNDWDSLAKLFEDVEDKFKEQNVVFDVVVVNDGSTANLRSQFSWRNKNGVIGSVSVLDLKINVGNQYALAIGLKYASDKGGFDAVLVMDADGEDRVDDAVRMVNAWKFNLDDKVVVGLRSKRSESAAFKFGYFLYRAIFRLLTGRHIVFGNFSLVPHGMLQSLAHRPELPHHYAATILRSRLPIMEVATVRGERYFGKSHMNAPSLVFHAVAAFSVFSDVLYSRLLICSTFVGASCGVGIVLVIVVRLFTDLVLPNWATVAISFLLLLVVQVILFTLTAGFLVLMGRSSVLRASIETSQLVYNIQEF